MNHTSYNDRYAYTGYRKKETYDIVTSGEAEEGRSHFGKCLIHAYKGFGCSGMYTRILTSAMSALIPLGLFLKVGGNSDNMAKLTVCALPLVLSRVTKNLFPVEP